MCCTISFPHSTNHCCFYWCCRYQNAMILLIKSRQLIVLHKRPDLRKFSALIFWENAVPLLRWQGRAHCKRKFPHPLPPAGLTIRLSYVPFFPFLLRVFCSLRNEKYLAAVAAGKWVLRKSYLEASREAGFFVDEASHEWGLEVPGEASNKLASAAQRWRLKLIQERGVRKTLALFDQLACAQEYKGR